MKYVAAKQGRLLTELGEGWYLEVEPGQLRAVNGSGESGQGAEYGSWVVYSTLGSKVLGVGVENAGVFVLYYQDTMAKRRGGYWAVNAVRVEDTITLDERRTLNGDERNRWI